MSILFLFGIGIASGLIAALLACPGRRFIFVHVVIGIIGSMLGGILVARLLGDKFYSADRFDAEASLWSCGGAALLLTLARMVDARLQRRQP